MVTIPKEPWYLPTVKTLVLTLSTQVLTAKAAEGSPGNSYLLLDGSLSSTLFHRASCREELAKPLPFFQGSLKDIGHTYKSVPPSLTPLPLPLLVLWWLSWQMAALRYHPSQWRRPIRKVRSYESTITLYLSLKNSQPGGDKGENNSTLFLWVLLCPAFIKIPPGAEETKRRNCSGHTQQSKANAKAVGSRTISLDTTQWFALDDHSIYLNWLFIIMKPYMDWLKGTRRNPCMTCLLPQHH